MDYNQLLEEIKNLFLPQLKAVVHQAVYDANPDMPEVFYRDMIYTDIMALGYNFNDSKKAVDDIYELQSMLHGESDELYQNIQQRISETKAIYPFFVNVFSLFHKQSQDGLPFNEVIQNVKIELEK
ncbi:MAG: hypothetical protein V4698_03435 [Bacteroidota bacterium]